MVRGLTVNGINHHFLRSDALDGLQPWADKLLLRVVYIDSVFGFAFHKHGLNNDMPLEKLQAFNDFVDIIRGLQWAIHRPDIVHVDRVHFQYVVVYLHQRLTDTVVENESAVAEHADFGLGTVLVAQFDGVFDDCFEIRMTCRFAVPRKSQYVGKLLMCVHFAQFGL